MAGRWKTLLALVWVSAGCRAPSPAALPATIRVQPAPTAAAPLTPHDAKDDSAKQDPAVPRDEVQAASSWLVDHLAQVERRRAYLTTVEDGYWTLEQAEGGEPSLRRGDRLPQREAVVVIEHHAQHLRVRAAGDGVELLVYLAHAAFAETNLRRTPLLQRTGQAHQGAGLSLPPGAQLELLARRQGLTRVRVGGGWLTAEGALRNEQMGRVFLWSPAEEEKAKPRSSSYRCQLTGPVPVMSSPGGHEVARVEASWMPCTHLEDLGGWHRVKMAKGGYELSGVVPAARVNLASGGRGLGRTNRGRGGWATSHATYRFLWPGDRLFALHDKLLVGRVVRRRLRVADRGVDDRGMHRVTLSAPYWGLIDLRVTADTMKAAIDREQRFRDRIEISNLRSPSGHEIETREALARQHDGISRCFDQALVKHGPTSTYQYRVTYGPGPIEPRLQAVKTSDARLERCLRYALRPWVFPSLAQASFELHLKPDPAVGP